MGFNTNKCHIVSRFIDCRNRPPWLKGLHERRRELVMNINPYHTKGRLLRILLLGEKVVWSPTYGHRQAGTISRALSDRQF